MTLSPEFDKNSLLAARIVSITVGCWGLVFFPGPESMFGMPAGTNVDNGKKLPFFFVAKGDKDLVSPACHCMKSSKHS